MENTTLVSLVGAFVGHNIVAVLKTKLNEISK